MSNQGEPLVFEDKANYIPGCMRAFDNAGFVVHTARDSDDNLYHFMTLEEWTFRELMLGRCGNGTVEEQLLVAKNKFAEAVLDESKRSRQVNGVWLLEVFKGVEEQVAIQHERTVSTKRRRTFDDEAGFEAAMELKAEAQKALSSFQEASNSAAATGVDVGMSASVDIPAGMERNPVVAKPDAGEFVDDILRDVLMAIRRQELLSELLAESAKIRDRLVHIKDTIDSFERTVSTKRRRTFDDVAGFEAAMERMAEEQKALSYVQKALSSFQDTIDSLVRQGASAGETVAKPPTVSKFEEVVTASAGDSCNVTMPQNIEEAKEVPFSAPFMLRAPEARGPFESNKSVQSQAKWLQAQVDKATAAGGMTYAMAAYKPGMAKQVQNLVSQHFEPLISKVAFPSAYGSLRGEIFPAQHFALSETHVNFSWTPFGLDEVRLLMTGSYKVAGVRVDAITLPEAEGGSEATFLQKIDFVATGGGFTQFMTLAQEEGKGFWLVHDEEFSLVKLPSAHLLFTCGCHASEKENATGAHGLRWSMLNPSSQPELKSVSRSLSDLLGATRCLP
jgi:hypothetical protein